MKVVDDEGLKEEVKKLSTMPLHLGAFVLSISKRNMNNFIHTINGFYAIDSYYGDTESLYRENKHWDKLDRAGLIGKTVIKTVIKMVVFSLGCF